MHRKLNSLTRRILNRLRFGDPQLLCRRRSELASIFIFGKGIEIGALHHPLELPPHAEVQYVDHLSTPDLKSRYPELNGDSIISVDIVDDGETLVSIPDASQDFVIANHLLEHCQNPIGTLENWLRVLNKDGVLFLSIPDKRYTFDCSRPITALDHVIRDWREGPEWSRKQHYQEWARLVERVSKEQIQPRANILAQSNVSIHFHVWTADAIRELLIFYQSNLRFDFEIVLFVRNGIENVSILKRWGRESV